MLNRGREPHGVRWSTASSAVLAILAAKRAGLMSGHSKVVAYPNLV